MDGNETAAGFINSISWEDLPDNVRSKVKMCLVDTVGAIIGGILTPVSDIAAAYAGKAWNGNESTVLLHDMSSTASGAAFVNATTANALDCDDGGKYTLGHLGAQVFPTALAVGEKLKIDGKAILTAMVVGYEIAHRAGRCWHSHQKIYQADGSWGSMACAATAANLMRLDKNQIGHALGIAEYYAPNVPMERDLRQPAMVKHGHGWGAMTGIAAAELAGEGFTGIPSLFGFPEYQNWVADLGKEYVMVEGVGFKCYCSCGWGHMPILAVKKLKREYNWNIKDVEAIRVEGHYWTIALETSHPMTTEEAQFSVKWPLAAFLLDGELGPDQILEKRFDDIVINALVDKIELVFSEELDDLYRPNFEGEYGGSDASRVLVYLKNGAVLDSGIVPVESGMADPGNESQVEDKFRWLARYVLKDNRIDTLLEMLWHFEEIKNINEFIPLIKRR